MLRRFALTGTVALTTVAFTAGLSACSADIAPEPVTTASAPTVQPPAKGSLPACDAVAAALGALIDELAYDEAVSTAQTAQESYEQRVCVFLTPDRAAQLGVTIAAIPFLQSELDYYATLPSALDDERTAARGSVLQTFQAGDGDDGHLDRSLYLYDLDLSITLEGYSAEGSTIASLPQLTLPAAVDAAFAVRELMD